MHCRFLCMPSSPDGGKNFLFENAAWKAGLSGDPLWILLPAWRHASVPDGTAGEFREDLVLNPESERSAFTPVKALQRGQKPWVGVSSSESLDDRIWTSTRRRSAASVRVTSLLVSLRADEGLRANLRPVPFIRNPPCLCFFEPLAEEPESSELPS